MNVLIGEEIRKESKIMKKRNLLITLAITMLVLVTAISLGAQRRGSAQGGDFGMHGPRAFGPHGHFAGPMFQFRHMLRKLDLSEEQRTRIRGLFEAHRESLSGTREALRENRLQLLEATDPGTIQALADQQGELMSTMIESAAFLRLDVRAELTPEQLDKLEEFREWRRNRPMRK